MPSNIRDEGRGPLTGIADRVAAKEIGKLWSMVEQLRGYDGKSPIAAVTREQLEASTREIYARIDKLAVSDRPQTGGGGGGTFVSTGNSAPSTSLDVRPLDNAWTGSNLWAADNANLSKTEWDPATATMHYVRDDVLPAKPGIYEIGSIFIDTTYRGSPGTDPSNTEEWNKRFASLVPIHMHAVSRDNHHGNAWGFATEAYNEIEKLGTQSPTQLIGAEVSIINKIFDSRAWRHCGALIVFKNRMDADEFPTHGKPPDFESYNRNTFGIFIDTGAGRKGGAFGSGGDPSIECGWWRGIYFSAHSLDSSNGDGGGNQHSKAVGIDMGDLDGIAPEGGHFYDRVHAAIALPPNTNVSWDGSTKNVHTRFNDGTGRFEFRVGASANAAINFSNGAYFCGPGLGYFMNLGAPGGNLFGMMSSGGKVAGGLIGTYTYNGMVKFRIDGDQYYFPFYRQP